MRRRRRLPAAGALHWVLAQIFLRGPSRGRPSFLFLFPPQEQQLRLHAGDLITQVAAQKTVASLGDPCDCNQNHDYWQTMIDTMLLHLHPELPNALFTIGSASQAFFSKQSCIWSSDNEDSHRLAALSDCIPGFVSMKISCVTHLVWKAYEAISASADPESDTDPQFVEAKASVDLALGHMAEVLRTAAF